jgi:hypothetical protein
MWHWVSQITGGIYSHTLADQMTFNWVLLVVVREQVPTVDSRWRTLVYPTRSTMKIPAPLNPITLHHSNARMTFRLKNAIMLIT